MGGGFEVGGGGGGGLACVRDGEEKSLRRGTNQNGVELEKGFCWVAAFPFSLSLSFFHSSHSSSFHPNPFPG